MKCMPLPQCIAAGLATLCIANAAAAAPEVVFDSGRSVPLAPYVAQLVGDAEDPGVLDGVPFPIRTTLKSSVLAKDGLQVFDPTWLTQPMFVLAADSVSMRWLTYNHAKLVQMNAVGIVVQSLSAAAFKALQKQAQPLHLAPETSPWLASKLSDLGAGVYPLLIQPNGRVYQILGGGHE